MNPRHRTSRTVRAKSKLKRGQMKLLAVDAAALALMLGLSERTIRKMDAAGRIPAPVRFGRACRWPVSEIKKWLKAGAPDRRRWVAMTRSRDNEERSSP